jgi:hypothetical protein
MTETEVAPTIVSQTVHSMVTITVQVAGLSAEWGFIHQKSGGPTHTQFMPDTLSLRYRDGKLDMCSLTGVALRQDGHPYLDRKTAGCSYLSRHKLAGGDKWKLSSDAPAWVRGLVLQYGKGVTLP